MIQICKYNQRTGGNSYQNNDVLDDKSSKEAFRDREINYNSWSVCVEDDL